MKCCYFEQCILGSQSDLQVIIGEFVSINKIKEYHNTEFTRHYIPVGIL